MRLCTAVSFIMMSQVSSCISVDIALSVSPFQPTCAAVHACCNSQPDPSTACSANSRTRLASNVTHLAPLIADVGREGQRLACVCVTQHSSGTRC